MRSHLIHRVHAGVLRLALVWAISGALLVLSPFAAALEVHHALAAADHDGHEHSDSDLCQWVQHHTGSSLLTDPPPVVSLFHVAKYDVPALAIVVSGGITSTGPPRGPPLS